MSGYTPCLTMERVDRARFVNAVQPLNRPVLLKGQVADWPAVQAAKTSPEAVGAYLKGFDLGIKTPVSLCSAQESGRYFYNADVSGLNYRTINHLLPDIIDRLLDQQDRMGGDSIYMQSLPVDMFLPRFMTENVLPLVDATVLPRIWIGNRLSVQTHYDQSSNIACLVAGARRFVLFPPDQLKNLYPGPDDFTPGGTPVSMAVLEDPDFERFPRLAQALETAQVADMEPGDALYIPYGWWHNVTSLAGFNVLVNYWWNAAPSMPCPPAFALKAALLSLRDLPAEQKAAWKAIFDYYIFKTSGDPVAHLPEAARGSYGELTPERIQALKDQLKATLLK